MVFIRWFLREFIISSVVRACERPRIYSNTKLLTAFAAAVHYAALRPIMRHYEGRSLLLRQTPSSFYFASSGGPISGASLRWSSSDVRKETHQLVGFRASSAAGGRLPAAPIRVSTAPCALGTNSGWRGCLSPGHPSRCCDSVPRQLRKSYLIQFRRFGALGAGCSFSSATSLYAAEAKRGHLLPNTLRKL